MKMTPNITNGLAALTLEDGDGDDQLLFHVFLPSTYTPGGKTGSEVNPTFLPLMTSLLARSLPKESLTWQSFQLWETHTNLDPGPTAAAIAMLDVGQTLPICVHEQNATILITQQEQDILTISTFRLSLPAERISSNNSTFAMTLPTNSITTPKVQLLTSKSLIRQLSDLHEVDMQESAATIKKSNTTVIEKRDVAEPVYISKWFLSVITNKATRQSTPSDFPHICKKFRDSVRFKGGSVQRRSGIWVSIKATLHLLLVKELGCEAGYFVYKTILIRFMIDLVKGRIPSNTPNMTRLEYLAKIARRVFKLDQLLRRNDAIFPTWALDLYQETLQETATVSHLHHDAMKKALVKFIDECKKAAKFDLSDIVLWKRQSLRWNNFRELFDTGTTMGRFFKLCKLEVPIQIRGIRHRDMRSQFNYELLDAVPHDRSLTLYDFEKNVACWHTMLSSADSSCIWNSFQKYHKVGKDFYKGDSVGYSRFILTLLKIIRLWDDIVCQQFPLLLEHRSGIDLDVLKDLLITNRRDLISLGKIETYFVHRDKKAKFPSLIDELSPTPDSFANRFVESSSDKEFSKLPMLRAHILDWGRSKAEAKLIEVHAKREQCEKIEGMARQLECEYTIDNWKRKHEPRCEKCKLNQQAKKMAVVIYESPLPVGRDLQNAVVFELRIPEQIGVLRDLLFLFKKEVTGNILSTELYGPWHTYCQLVSCARPRNFLVGLWSERKTFKETHYRDLHPTSADSDFIKVNGMNCVYASSSGQLVTITGYGIKSQTTLKVEKFSRYFKMQSGIEGKVTQNEAIASQNECHPDMSLSEFVEFQSLRSISNLQFRNLFRAINAGNLSLKEESVFNLLCQVMWNVGDRAAGNEYLRENQLDFSCNEFCEEFFVLLEGIRIKHADNWKDHYVMLSVIYLAQTISQLNPAVERKAFKLLNACRQDAVRWSAEIQRILSSLIAAPREEIDSLRIKLIEVNCCIAVTFRVDELFQYEIIQDGDFIFWLLAVARIHDNMVLLGSDSEKKLKQSLKILVNRIDELGVDLELFIKEAVRSSDLLTQFVEAHHSGSEVWKMREKQNMTWNCFEGGQVYYCDISPVDGYGEVSRIQMDLIKGKFLVDGCPVGYLPVSIEQHRDFRRAFGNKTFEVEGYAFQPGRMITKDKFLSSNYSFYLMDNKLTIIEHRDNDVTLELIEDTKFTKNIPDLLIENYTHWFNYKAGQFEFFKKEEKLVMQQPEYILKIRDADNREYHLFSVKEPNKVVIDVACPNYSSILRVVERLEQPRYTIVYCDMRDEGYVYTVDLPRMGLQFTVRNVVVVHAERKYRSYQNGSTNNKPVERKRRLGDLVSKDMRGMRISTNQQSLETLIGLRNGLYLEDANVNSNAKINSILLVPHARPYVRNKEVYIDTTEIRSPSFFAYEVDTRLKQLKSGDSRASWLYLAYLHALTNFGVPDPFTGVTGQERALQILQAGLCFSSEPLDDESLFTMKMFMELCPVRVFYPPNMRTFEVLKTKDEFPLRCVGDAYYLIIDQLIDDSRRLDFLYPDWKGYDPMIEERCHWEEDLTWKAYWNRHYYSNESAQLRGEFLHNEPTTEPFADYTNVDDTMINTIALSSDLHNWTINYCKPKLEPKVLLKSLLNGRDLKGTLREEKFPILEGVYVWQRVDFRDYWLDLYNLARKVKRKALQSEWTFLLTYFNFKKDFTSVDHLGVLHTIAVHSQLFAKLDPPDYESYTNTLETTFDKEEVGKILLRYKKPWESYLDRNFKEMKDWEDEIQFAERMKPVQLELLNSQVENIATLIEKRWPVDNLDWVQVEFEERSEVELGNALVELGLRIKAWYKNRELSAFLDEVAATLSLIKYPPAKAKPECRKLFRQQNRYELEDFCRRPQTTVDFRSLTANKEFKLSEQSSIQVARQIFHATNQTKEKPALLPSDNDIQDFPLSLSEEQDDPILSDYMRDLKTSWGLHHKELKRSSKLISNNEALLGPGRARGDYLSTEQRRNNSLCLELWELCKQKFIPLGPITSKPIVDQILLNAELFPRIVPLTMLKLLLQKPETEFENDLRDLIGGYAVEMTLEMKFSRCIRISQLKGQSEGELLQEMANNGHENWNPSDRPDWLLFEIESDLLIRPVQAKVAERMENPIDGENSVIQLNMGEGKTWVIVPLLALSLANGENLCRITVLKSLFQINKTYLSFKIGSMLLDRRIYCFPCRRDFRLGVPQSEAMLNIYEECLDLKGVVLTLPEYRLSFELKAYERFHIKAFEEGLGLFRLHDWLKEKIRDVLDESDEILHVKYQLIYTLGKQLPVTGGTTRWTVIQDLLSILPEEMALLHQKLGPGFVEMKTRETENAFPYCRILKMECASDLVERLATRIINRKTPISIPNLPQKLWDPLFQFFTNEQLSRDGLNLILKAFPETIQELFLVIRGYLACGVLTNCLTKRWRVNFGVAATGPTHFRRMAVPFRAKDVASDRIEFGHPDVAILLTQLSYYYSGLSDEQMEHCFGALLNLEPNPAQEYSKWVSLISEEQFPNKCKIRTLSSINFNDFFQKTEVVFPLLRYNRNIINFYLSKAVFPQESKQFGWKIGCSPWDLCNTFTTGFSGTNDSKILLPSTIKQRDLDELKGTNGGVLASLLLQADNYTVLEKVTAVKLLKELVANNIRILLDVGALMLELDNEQVSRKWLQLLNEANVTVDAAVFFDSNDKLMVLDRLNTITPLELSTFRNRLDRCVVYLDDGHTRGTDLKIPSGNTAVVTLGKGVGKDKLVQGCMRMRKLGKGHNVVFWASTEVDESIKSFHPGKITAKEVLLWSIRNNQQQIKDGFVHWASSGVYVAQKLSSLKLYENSPQEHTDLVVLSESCSQKEQIDLTAMYGDTRQIIPFPRIVDHLLKRVKRELAKLLYKKSTLKVDCSSIVEDYGQCVVDHVEKYVPNMMRSTQLLDEEQERELEHELEAQCHKQLPLRAKPLENTTSPQVLAFMMTGSLNEIEKWTVKLPLTLQNTSVWKTSPTDRWGKHIYCTKDFISVVKSEAKRLLTDDYLRPVEWFASVQYQDKTVLLIISNFEAGRYLHLFRSNKTRATMHMHNALTSEDQLSLHDRPNLSLPKRVVAFDKWLNPPLTLFSGGWYFTKEEEERDYAWYLGYLSGEIPGRIVDRDGVVGNWIKKEFWGEVDVARIFDECPEGLVREILRVRWGIRKVGKESGVGKVIS